MNFSNIVKKKFNGSENRAKAGKTLKKSAKTFASFVQVREKEKRSRVSVEQRKKHWSNTTVKSMGRNVTIIRVGDWELRTKSLAHVWEIVKSRSSQSKTGGKHCEQEGVEQRNVPQFEQKRFRVIYDLCIYIASFTSHPTTIQNPFHAKCGQCEKWTGLWQVKRG